MSSFGDVFSVAPSFAGAYLNYRGQKSANRANLEIARMTNAANLAQAREQMSFQERLSSTAYQRAVHDMKQAGINPMLAASLGGSSTPPGASVPSVVGAPMQNEMAGVQSGISSAVDALRTRYDIQNLRETNKKIISDTELNKALKASALEDAKLKASNAKFLHQQAKNLAELYPGMKIEGDIDRGYYGQAVRHLKRLNPVAGLGAAVSGVYRNISKGIMQRTVSKGLRKK